MISLMDIGRLRHYLGTNNYIYISLQKGAIAGIPGCLEHIGLITQLLREVKEGKGDLVVLLLDLANTYGSVPNKLVSENIMSLFV